MIASTLTKGILLAIVLVPYVSHSLANNYARSSRQTACGRFQFKCGSGECLQEEVECDGKEDCRDGSDETDDCTDIPCLPHLFKCSYGACISKSKECDGNKDCKDNSDETSPRCKVAVTSNPVQEGCLFDEFRCKSGQCIKETLLCDGVGNCDDASDETLDACNEFVCPLSTFRCNYGACVNGNAKCNGKRECYDGSDEIGCGGVARPTTVPPPTTAKPTQATTASNKPGGCILPKNPPNGVFKVQSSSNAEYAEGAYVEQFSAMQLTCFRGYKAYGAENGTAFCYNGQWSIKTVLECRRACRPLKSSNSTHVKCSDTEGNPVSCETPFDYTYAHFSCAPFYEIKTEVSQSVCSDGTWSSTIRCSPVCGMKRPRGVPNVIGGAITTKGDYPWHAGLYNKRDNFNYLCGGSIINQRLILSAAHCIANNNDGKQYEAEYFTIAVGKYYREYNDPKDIMAQYSDVLEIHTTGNFKGQVWAYRDDIALLVLKDTLKLSLAVQPVCIEYAVATYEQKVPLTDGLMGVVVGWGYTVEGKRPAQELKELMVPYVDPNKCLSNVGEEFAPFIAHDKFCAGYLNQSTSVCEGDSGGGLTFPYNNRYYIKGIVSTSPQREGSCNSDQYSTYTSVATHASFIQSLVVRFNIYQ